MMNRYEPHRHHRRSIRLRGYDYTQDGVYFVTVITQNRSCLFGELAGETMCLNPAGRVAEECWRAVPDHFPHVELDEFVIMPNHVHGIIRIVGAKNFSPLQPDSVTLHGGTTFRSPTRTIGSVVRGFKIGVTKWFRTNTEIQKVWQRNYYEHIIRNEAALTRIRQYTKENPARWAEDDENPKNWE